jgi:hypothetical protein
MIRSFTVQLNAAHPELPLFEATAIVGSASTAFIRRVPASVGSWHITKVYVNAQYPDGSNVTVEASVGAEGVWTATLPATETSGRVKSGFSILADGIDENGDPITSYILGIADFAVYTRDMKVQPGTVSYQLKYFDTAPDPVKKGDVAPFGGDLKLYNGTAWVGFSAATIGNITESLSELADNLAENYYTAAQTDAAIDKIAAYYITYTAQGAAFPTRADLINAQTVYSGGVVRTPTRNDYAVVLDDETHDGAEYRYIYAVADGETVGQWEAQYPIETNDYAALSNKPQVNGVTLTGNKTAANLDLIGKTGGDITGTVRMLNGETVKYTVDSDGVTLYGDGGVTKRVQLPSLGAVPNAGGHFSVIEDLAYPQGGAYYTVGQLALVNGVLMRCVLEGQGSAASFSACTVSDALDTLRYGKLDKAADPVSIGGGSKTVSQGATNYIDIGKDTTIGGSGTMAIGNSATAGGDNALAIGPNANVQADNALAIGSNTTTTGTQALAIGNGATAAAYGHAEGLAATAVTDGTAIGFQAHATKPGVAIGAHAEVGGTNGEGIAIGHNAKVTVDGAVQIGPGTNGTANSVQIGSTVLLDGNRKLPGALILDGTVSRNAIASAAVDTTPTANSQKLITSGGVKTAVDGAGRYAIGQTITASATLADRTMNRIVPTADNTADISLSFPAAVSGKAREFQVLITNTAGNTGAITFNLQTGWMIYGDGLDQTIPSGETWLFTVREVAANEFDTSAVKMEGERVPYWGLTFEAEEPNATVKLINIGSGGTLQTIYLEYSTDGITWKPYSVWAYSDAISMPNVGDCVYFRAQSGRSNKYFSSSLTLYRSFVITGRVAAKGNIASIVNQTKGHSDAKNAMGYSFCFLFAGCRTLTSAPALPATTLYSYCYYGMFQACTALSRAPEILPATTLAQYCYRGMFNGCTSLSVAPEISATGTANYCCESMFSGCTSLTKAPILYAISPTAYAYRFMFSGCTSLNEVEVRFSAFQNGATQGWMTNVPTGGTFKCPAALGTDETISRGVDACPSGWTVVNI